LKTNWVPVVVAPQTTGEFCTVFAALVSWLINWKR